MSSQVVTFYEDEAKTNALYPRTKVSAISDDDDKALSETIDELNNKIRINYLRPTLQTQTKNGVTCTNNGDGTYTLNGTASSSSYGYVDFTLERAKRSGTVKLIGLPFKGSQSTIAFGGTGIGYVAKDTIFTLNNEEFNPTILVYNGYTCNNVVIKPMITDDLSATYDDFISYNDSLVTGSSQYFFGGIDTSRVLASNVTQYTATEDCYAQAIGSLNDNVLELNIDNIKILRHYSTNGWTLREVMPLKKGQVVITNHSLNIYGVKK